MGRTVLWNLISSPFGGTIYPVNPKRANILGIRAYRSLQALPEIPDLVVVCTPAGGRSGAAARVRGARRSRAASSSLPASRRPARHGKQLEAEITETIQGRMRIIGPNCLGVMNPILGLNATFANSMARPGNVAFISQSGALCTAVLDWSHA